MEIIVPVRSFLLIFILWKMANLLELARSQPVRPLCYTQISAANQACAFLYPEVISHSLFATNGSVANGSRHDHSSRDDHAHDDDDDKDHEDDDDDDDDGGDDDDDGGDDNEGGDDDDDDGGDDEGGDDDDNGDDDDGGGGDHRRRRHKKRKRKHRKHRKAKANKECCRWLAEVDNDCVCEALLKLPNFLVKPWHAVVVRVGQTCKLTYKCHGIE